MCDNKGNLIRRASMLLRLINQNAAKAEIRKLLRAFNGYHELVHPEHVDYTMEDLERPEIRAEISRIAALPLPKEETDMAA